MCFFFLSFFFYSNALLALAGARSCWLQDLPNVRQAECEVPLQVGACPINRVLIKAGAPLSESEAPRQKASGYSGSKQVDSISPAVGQNLNEYQRKHLCSPGLFLANMAAVKNVF